MTEGQSKSSIAPNFSKRGYKNNLYCYCPTSTHTMGLNTMLMTECSFATSYNVTVRVMGLYLSLRIHLDCDVLIGHSDIVVAE